jgi:hypothetical protein
MRRSNSIRRAAERVSRSWLLGTSVALASTLALGQGTKVTTFRHEIAPGKIAEECRALSAGEVVRYRFQVSAVVDFNVHFHRGNAVEYPVKKDGVTEDASNFVAPSVEEFCWMWSNRNASPVIVEGEIAPHK